MKRLAGAVYFICLFGAADLRADSPTYNKDIAPILWKNCAGCHRPGEIGPFSLLTYKDAAKRASFLAEITESRRMPPWKPEPGFGSFHDERRLTEPRSRRSPTGRRREHLRATPKTCRRCPSFPKAGSSARPTWSSKPPSRSMCRRGRRHLPLLRDSDPDRGRQDGRGGRVSPWEPQGRPPRFALPRQHGAARQKDESEPGPGYASFGGPGILPTGGLGGWAPGAMPRLLPDGMGKFLRKGSDLVLQIHYHPDGKAETDQSSSASISPRSRPRRSSAGSPSGRRNLDIPAGEARYHTTARASRCRSTWRRSASRRTCTISARK